MSEASVREQEMMSEAKLLLREAIHFLEDYPQETFAEFTVNNVCPEFYAIITEMASNSGKIAVSRNWYGFASNKLRFALVSVGV